MNTTIIIAASVVCLIGTFLIIFKIIDRHNKDKKDLKVSDEWLNENEGNEGRKH